MHHPDPHDFATSAPATPSQVRYEQEIIGSILTSPECYAQARFLRPDDFIDADMRSIWTVIREHVTNQIPVTPQLIAQTAVLSGPLNLVALAAASTANIDGVARLATAIRDRNRSMHLAETISMARSALETGDSDWRTVTDFIEGRLTRNTETGLVMEAGSVRQAMISRLVKQSAPAIPLGIAPIDRHLGGGVAPSTFIMIGALGKTGKTVFLTTISYNWETANVPHVFFTLERRQEQIEELKVARQLGLSARSLRDHAASLHALPQAPRSTYYVHSTSIDAESIRHEILFLKSRFGIRAAMIDYWQLIQGQRKGESLNAFRGRVAQEIQRTCIDADIPILMTCQVGDSGGARDWEAAKTAANLFLQINRDRSSPETYFSVITTNITEESDIGTIASPSAILRPEGPYFDAR